MTWDKAQLADLLAQVSRSQGRLLGRMQGLGFDLQGEAQLQTLTQDVLKSSEIEGELLDPEQVRSSIARRLGMDIGALTPVDRDVEGVVEMMLDATQNYDQPLTEERLFGWHAALFPTGRSGMFKITVGAWRDDASGPMQVVSGPMGRERVHFQAPSADKLPHEMVALLGWLNDPSDIDPILKAGIAHFWFVTIHPFDDGNGRIARAIADLLLARSEGSSQRFYSMSSQIREWRKEYYAILEKSQTNLDITEWLQWFLDCLQAAIEGADVTLDSILRKARFWAQHASDKFNDRQRLMLNRLLNGFIGKLTNAKWAKLTKSSSDSALRDLNDLVARGILIRESAGGRGTSYALPEPWRKETSAADCLSD